MRVCLLIVLCATSALHAQPVLDSRDKRDVGVVNFAETPVAPPADGSRDGAFLSEATAATEQERNARSPDEYEDYEEVEEDGPEGRHLHKIKRKLKRKLKPHKYGGLLGGFGGYGGGFGGYGGGLGGYGGGHGGHHHHHHNHGGWQGPPYGGGGWNPLYGGGGHNRPQASAWNFGPFSFGFANAG